MRQNSATHFMHQERTRFLSQAIWNIRAHIQGHSMRYSGRDLTYDTPKIPDDIPMNMSADQFQFAFVT